GLITRSARPAHADPAACGQRRQPVKDSCLRVPELDRPLVGHRGGRRARFASPGGPRRRTARRGDLTSSARRRRALGLLSLCMADELKIVASVANEFEADAVCGALSDAGIRSMLKLANTGVGGRFGGGGA